MIFGCNPAFGGHLGRHFGFSAPYNNKKRSSGIGIVVNGFSDPGNLQIGMLYNQIGSIMVILGSNPVFGGHLGRHLEFLKTLNDARRASFGFVN